MQDNVSESFSSALVYILQVRVVEYSEQRAGTLRVFPTQLLTTAKLPAAIEKKILVSHLNRTSHTEGQNKSTFCKGLRRTIVIETSNA